MPGQYEDIDKGGTLRLALSLRLAEGTVIASTTLKEHHRAPSATSTIYNDYRELLAGKWLNLSGLSPTTTGETVGFPNGFP
jgi:hypothetical protein